MTHLAARAPARNSSHLGLIIVIEPTGSGDLFTARLNGRLLCKCRTPFCTAARLLLERGYAPGTLMVMRHAGSSTNALTATIAAAARLTVAERSFGNGPRFARWKPLPLGAGAAPTRSMGLRGSQGNPGTFNALTGSTS